MSAMPLDNSLSSNALAVAFLVGVFPVASETFILNQITGLLDRGIDVTIYSLQRGDRTGVSDIFKRYNLQARTVYLDPPAAWSQRLIGVFPLIFRIVRYPHLWRALNPFRYGRNALSLKLLYWTAPWMGKRYDVVHCHFGPVANKFLWMNDIGNVTNTIVTTFYGYDVSTIFRSKPATYYDALKKRSSLFFVMSENMNSRVVAYGFPAEKVHVLPVSIDVNCYPYHTRHWQSGEPFHIVSVGRFVEKKGFDTLLRALQEVKEKTKESIHCHIIGGGPLEHELRSLTAELDLASCVEFRGYMKIEDIIEYFKDMHVFVQPSQTARDGDME